MIIYKHMEVLEFFDKHYKILTGAIIGIIVLCAVVIIAVPIIRENERQTILEIGVAPTTAKIEIDGKEYANGAYVFEPGSYTAHISQEGFTSKEVSFSVKEHEQNLLAAFIVNEEEGLAYFERSAADMESLRLSYENDEEVRVFIDEYDEKLEIRNKLPINASYDLKDTNPGMGSYMIFMNISDGSNHGKCHHAFCLLVTGDRKNEARIKEILDINGYEYNDYEVIYE